MLTDELKQTLILNLLGMDKKENTTSNIHDYLLGNCVLVRTYSAGVHIGTLKEKDGQTVLLTNTKRIWYWDGACSLSQLSSEGSKNINNCKISVEVPNNLIEQVIEIMSVNDEVKKQIYEAAPWKK